MNKYSYYIMYFLFSLQTSLFCTQHVVGSLDTESKKVMIIALFCKENEKNNEKQEKKVDKDFDRSLKSLETIDDFLKDPEYFRRKWLGIKCFSSENSFNKQTEYTIKMSEVYIKIKHFYCHNCDPESNYVCNESKCTEMKKLLDSIEASLRKEKIKS